MPGLDEKLMEHWREVGRQLGVRVIAPYTVEAGGQKIECEAYLPDFGSPRGAVVISRRTERRERAALRRVPDLWYSMPPKRGFARASDELEDLGWFGPAGQAPSWYRDKALWRRDGR
jgi:hypothetical protein